MPKRRSDWLVGRLTAKSVVAAALPGAGPGDRPLRAIEIANAPGGMPYARVAPEGCALAGVAPGERLPLSISISHAGGHALCAATSPDPAGGPVRALGVDLGVIESRSREFVATFFTDEEQRLVRDAPRAERDLRANAIWCAKEAVLKALGVGLTVDTLDVACFPGSGAADPAEWPLAPADGAWRPFIALCRPALVAGGGTIRGVWRSFPGFVGALAYR